MLKTIDARAARHNWQSIRRRARAKNIFAVLKNNAYGHGLLDMAAALADCADGVAVARMAEAQALRDAGYAGPVLLLEGVFNEDELPRAAALKLWLVAHSAWQLRALAAMPASAKITVFVKVNTGMNRLGFDAQDALAALQQARAAPATATAALMTHFARADEPGGVADALARFAPLRAAARAPVSLANSAAALFAGDLDEDWARVGIALYGSSPAPRWQSAANLGLRPVMTLKTRLIATRRLAAGEAIGYGGEFVAKSAMPVGIADCGYGDGYPRRNGLFAVVGGARAPVVGRVSMQMLALDLSACAGAQAGDEATLWGENPHIDELAAACGCISYELFTAAGHAPARLAD